MNSLSWLIYFASVVGKVNVAATLAGIGILAVLAIRCVATGMHNDLCDYHRTKKTYPKWGLSVISAAVFFVVAIATPSQTVLYAIAASQYGEQLAKTPTITTVANEATDALRAWLKAQTSEKK